MFITLTIETREKKADIRIDSEQKIGDALNVLRAAGIFSPEAMPDYLRSHLKQSLVSAYKTFSQESIFDGDILTVIY